MAIFEWAIFNEEPPRPWVRKALRMLYPAFAILVRIGLKILP